MSRDRSLLRIAPNRGLIHHSDYADLGVQPRDRVLSCGGGVR
jgi:hypothetical protein